MTRILNWLFSTKRSTSVVDSTLQESINSLSSKSTGFGVGVGNSVGVGSSVGVGNGSNVGVATKFETEEQASMVTNSNIEREIIFEFFIFAPVNIK
jgi:hypothetical protein